MFSSYAPHKSNKNNSNQCRRALYVTYNGISEGSHRVNYYQERSKFLNKDENNKQISTINHFSGDYYV